jgi:glycosyltransferase involved in cell wall biosynthesis
MLTNSYCHFTHVELLGPHEKWRIEEIDGIRVVWLRTIHYSGNDWRRGANMLSNTWRSLQFARTIPEKPDLVIGPSVPLGTGWAASRIARMKSSTFIFEIRDIWPQSLVDLGMMSRDSLLYKIFHTVEKYLYKKAHRISAVLPLTWKHVENNGADAGKVHWIPNGANLELFSKSPLYIPGSLPITVMYVGGFSSTHDVSTIIKAAEILQREGMTDYRFIIVGSGKQRSNCEGEANNLGLQNVEFRDAVPKSGIPNLQRQADVLIASVKNTPVYQFGINSNKIYDYLASARPIIFSGNAPNDPIAESGAGFSIPPEDPQAMAEALIKIRKMTSEERIEMGNRGRRYVEREFDIRKLAIRMETLLFQALDDRIA